VGERCNAGALQARGHSVLLTPAVPRKEFQTGVIWPWTAPSSVT